MVALLYLVKYFAGFLSRCIYIIFNGDGYRLGGLKGIVFISPKPDSLVCGTQNTTSKHKTAPLASVGMKLGLLLGYQQAKKQCFLLFSPT
jgi:hypothetical protein